MSFLLQSADCGALTDSSDSIWGGGFLYQLGVLDYSGGYVIHLSSGTAGKLIDRVMEVSG